MAELGALHTLPSFLIFMFCVGTKECITSVSDLTSCVIQVELCLFSSQRDSGDIFFKH